VNFPAAFSTLCPARRRGGAVVRASGAATGLGATVLAGGAAAGAGVVERRGSLLRRMAIHILLMPPKGSWRASMQPCCASVRVRSASRRMRDRTRDARHPQRRVRMWAERTIPCRYLRKS
jgi:hypothetical protein